MMHVAAFGFRYCALQSAAEACSVEDEFLQHQYDFAGNDVSNNGYRLPVWIDGRPFHVWLSERDMASDKVQVCWMAAWHACHICPTKIT